jgi:hypothetical protein
MKAIKNIFVLAFCCTALFSSCKKENGAVTDEEIETTMELTEKQAISDNLDEDAAFVLDEALEDRGLQGNFAPPPPNNFVLGCATVTVTPLIGFPKNIVIDFGNGCTSNGVFRSGIINVVLSDSFRRSGSVAVMTFNNYFVNSFKREGTITWTNTSVGGTRSWQRKAEDVKMTAPDGKFWIHNGLKTILQSEGAQTANRLDDVFLTTGSGTMTNSAGRTRNSTILEALQKKRICANIDKGVRRTDGPNRTAVLDFGDGTCDRIATLTINDRPPRTILLGN